MFTANTMKRLSKKVANTTDSTEMKYREIEIAGIDDIKILMVSDKNVYATGGVKVPALVMTATNPEFIATYGEHYILVGTSFLKLSHKIQMATIANEMLRSGLIAAVADMGVKTDMKAGKMERTGLGDDETVRVTDADNRVMLSSKFGKRTANKVCDRAYRMARCSVQLNMKAEQKAAKAEDALYTKKVYKAEIKEDKKANKADKKAMKVEVKAETKASKAATKAGKKAAKAEKKHHDPLTDIVSGIKDVVETIEKKTEGNGPEAATC